MGQIFTWEEVRLGKIPTGERFPEVADHLRDELFEDPSVASALLFGSVVRGDFGRRSDVDCVVIYETEREKAAMDLMRRLDKMAHGLHVPINFTPCDTLLARTRLHQLGSSFVRHLQASIDAGGLIKGSLVGLLAPTISAEAEIESYIRAKMFNLQESLAKMATFSEERFVSLLKKALEATTHVARKMLIYEGTLQGDSKREVRNRYRETMSPYMAALFDELLTLDAWYSSELETQIKEPDERRYRAALDSIARSLPEVLRFLRLNILRLNSMARS